MNDMNDLTTQATVGSAVDSGRISSKSPQSSTGVAGMFSKPVLAPRCYER